MKKLFAILLTLAMLLGLAACGSSGGGGEVTIVGTWKGAMNLSHMLGAAMQTDFDEPLNINMTFVFNEDSTYTATVDEDGIEALSEVMLDAMLALMEGLYAQQNLTLEAALQVQGLTMEQFTAQLAEQLDVAGMLSTINESGYYKYEDGKYYTAHTQQELEAEQYIEITYVTLTANTMTVTDVENDGQKLSEEVPDMFPMHFSRK